MVSISDPWLERRNLNTWCYCAGIGTQRECWALPMCEAWGRLAVTYTSIRAAVNLYDNPFVSHSYDGQPSLFPNSSRNSTKLTLSVRNGNGLILVLYQRVVMQRCVLQFRHTDRQSVTWAYNLPLPLYTTNSRKQCAPSPKFHPRRLEINTLSLLCFLIHSV